MAKAISSIEKLKYDVVIELADARAINISNINFVTNKPKLTLAAKSDLTDLHNKQDIIYYSKNDKNIKNIIIKKLESILKDKIKKAHIKGLVNPTFSILVIGLPNIGKSTLINTLVGKNKTIIENRPGVTRSNNLIKLNNMFYIYDTPGIMFKKIDNICDGYVLCLLNCIKKEIIPLNDVINFAFEYYKSKYFQQFSNVFQINKNTTFDEFILYCCKKYNFSSISNSNDVNRCYEHLFKLFSSNELFKVNYETL
ncbi:putative ribosome biogenesis GTPase A [Bacilli bacterium]|nr:putative ribosome biogenesis GTPase A [Bacilli bacterium]